MSSSDPTAEELQNYLNAKVGQFDELCTARNDGNIEFLNGNVVQAMLEELADIVNNARKQAVKLLMLQEELEDVLAEGQEGDEISIGFQSFKSMKDVKW